MCCGCGHDAPASESPVAEPSATVPADPRTLTQERVPADEPSLASERISFQTEDGVTIVATLRRAPVRGAAAVVLAHQLSSTRAEWDAVVERLSAPPGMTTLAIDLRGHGESTAGPDGALDWQSFEPSDYEAMAKDITAAVTFLRADERSRPNRVAVVGASIGSTAALLAAVADPSIGAVALVSPGRAYRGIDAITPASQLATRPLLTIAAQGETASVQAAQDMARVAPAGRYVASAGSTHGVRQFSESPASLDALVSFLRDPSAAPHAQAAAPAMVEAPPAPAAQP